VWGKLISMPRDSSRLHFPFFLLTAGAVLLATAVAFPARSVAADDKPVWSDREKPIVEQLHGLRKLPDDVRAQTTKELALQIRQLPVTPNKPRLAGGLANLSTEGDFGHDTLQEVANTLAAALREQPQPGKNGEPGSLYVELAELVRYEHVQAAMDAPQFAAATAELEANDGQRQQANFTLVDLHGKNWTLKDLQGKVVLLNFWATWCPPCRKEMPDLEALYLKLKDKDQGFVVLAISDEDASKVSPFLAERNITYPVLLDPGRKVNEQFRIEGIPKSFVYDRSGKLVAQSIDMRTERQFLEMLAQAGLQ
jgi:peroxiredoxin